MKFDKGGHRGAPSQQGRIVDVVTSRDATLNQGATGPGGRGVLWALTAGHRTAIVSLGVVTVTGALIEAAFLVLLTATLLALADGRDEVTSTLGATVSIPVALALGAVALVARLALSMVGVRTSARVVSETLLERRRRLARAHLNAAWSVQQAEPSGRILELQSSFVARITTAVLALTQALTAALSLVAFLGMGVFVEPKATLVMLGSLVVLGFVLAPLRRRIRGRSRALSRVNLEFAGLVAESATLGQEIQTFGVRETVSRRLDAIAVRNAKEQRAVQILNGMLTPLYTFLAYAAILGGLVAMHSIAVGDVAAVGAAMLLLLRSLSYGQQLLTMSGQITAVLPFIEVVEEASRRYEEAAAPSGTIIPGSVARVELSAVGYTYAADRGDVLREVTLEIGRGEMVGVIGPSGSGKSTLAQLVLGLREPTAGSVKVDGVDLREVDRDWWATRVAFVPQVAILITGTVAENLRFFRDGIDDAKLREAARMGNILADVEALPSGFDTNLGERGASLSGGQRQRLSIARALAGQPELLVLDEPTSALDGHSEVLIRETLASLHGRVATIVIAHRLSTLELCDRIVVIEDGRVTADDHPLELREHSEFYQRALAIAGIV